MTGSNAKPGASPFRRRTAPNSRSADTRSADTRSADTRSAATRTAGPSAATAGAATAATARPLPLTAPQPRTQPATRTPLHIVAPPDPEAKARRRRRLWVGALVSLACAGLFAIVGVRVLLAQGQGPVDKLESQVTAAQAENQRLRLDVARLESPSRVVAEAQARLGMVPPAVVIYLPALTTTPAG
jgi:cell division protein FtsL